MKSYPESKTLKVLPLGCCGAEDARKLYGAQQRLELQRRGEFVRGYLAQGSRRGGVQLDPVLRFHLGLEEPKG